MFKQTLELKVEEVNTVKYMISVTTKSFFGFTYSTVTKLEYTF